MPLDPVHRIFFAVRPPRAESNRMADLPTWQGQHQRVDRLHLTLAITDDFAARPDVLIGTMRNVGDTLTAAPFMVAFDQMSGGARSVALRPARRSLALADFQRALAAGLARHGVPLRSGWSFRPHITLSYRDSAPFNRPIEPIRWVVRDFVLIHSVVGRTQHFELGRWPLSAAPASDLFGVGGERPVDRLLPV